MKEIICYSSYLPKGTKQNISFMELLLDEHWAEGEIFCPSEIFQEVGGFNDRLTANWRYEFLLRAVQKYPFTAVGVSADSGEDAWKQDANYAKPGSFHLWQSKPPSEWMDNVRGRMGFVGSQADTFLCKTCPISPHPMVCYRLTGITAGHPPPLWTVTAPTAILPANTSRNSFLPDASIPLLQLCWQMLLCCLIPKRRPGGWRK